MKISFFSPTLVVALEMLVLCASPLFAQRTVPPIPPTDEAIEVLIDTDAKNEIDDQWALALAILRLDRFKIEGFVAAPFRLQGKPYSTFQQTIDASLAEIELVTTLAGAKNRWPIHAGSVPLTSMTSYSDSPGVDFIIERARAHTPENPLWLIVLGAPTNAAAAWLKAPDIADKIIVFWHGRSQWPTKCQNFNAQGDPFATRVLFESNLPLILFDTGAHLTVSMVESEAEVKPHGALGDYIHEARKPLYTSSNKGMFDLGDIAALVDPSIATWEVVDCPTVTEDLLYDFDNLNGKILRCKTVDRNSTFALLYDGLEESGGLVEGFPRVLLDTDPGGDIDDAGAFAMLHALADRGEIHILGIGISIGGANAVPYVDAVNTWYGRPNIPIGSVKNNPPYTEDFYMADIVANYPHDLTESAAPEAYKMYRQILAAQPNHSVTLVTVGPATNIARLLASGPDEHSPLTGVELVRQKISFYAAGGNGGGGLPNGKCGFNYRKDIPGAQYELANMPIEVPMVFAGGSGPQVMTGNFYNSPSVDPGHIIRRSYDSYFSGSNWDRMSWDQLRLLYACRPESRSLFATTAFGNITLDNNQDIKWMATPARNKAYAYVPSGNIPTVTAIIRELMLHTPGAPPLADHGANLVSPATYWAKSAGWADSGAYVYTRAFDGNEATEAHGSTGEHWIEFDFGLFHKISFARVLDDNSGGFSLGEWKVAYFDGTAWTDAFAYHPSNSAGWHERDFADIPNVRKVRFYGKPPSGGGIEIYEIEIYGKPQNLVENWRAQYGLAVDGSQDAAVLSADGIPALLKLASNLGDPATPNFRTLDPDSPELGGLPVFQSEGGFSFYYIQHTAASDLLLYSPVVSTDLANNFVDAFSIAGLVLERTISPVSGTNYALVKLKLDDSLLSRLFIRLSVAANP